MCGLLTAAALVAAPSSPPALWRDVARLNVHCLLTGPRGVEPEAGARLCARVRWLAEADAPLPTGILDAGDPAVLAPDAVTLLVHATRQPGLLVFAIRPFRNDGAPLLFAAAPRAVPDGGAAALDAALAQSLAEILPWRSQPSAAVRPVPTRP